MQHNLFSLQEDHHAVPSDPSMPVDFRTVMTPKGSKIRTSLEANLEGSGKKKLYSISIKFSNTANQNKPYIIANELIFLEQTTTKCWVCPKWMRSPQNAGLDVQVERRSINLIVLHKE